jgi:hypothetical protein
MNTYSLLRTALVSIVILLNGYSIAEGIQYQSYLGILLAMGSLVALAYGLHLIKKLKELDSEEESLY